MGLIAGECSQGLCNSGISGQQYSMKGPSCRSGCCKKGVDMEKGRRPRKPCLNYIYPVKNITAPPLLICSSLESTALSERHDSVTITPQPSACRISSAEIPICAIVVVFMFEIFDALHAACLNTHRVVSVFCCAHHIPSVLVLGHVGLRTG